MTLLEEGFPNRIVVAVKEAMTSKDFGGAAELYLKDKISWH